MYCVMLLFHVPFIRFYHEKKSLNDWEEGIKFMQDKTDLPDFFFYYKPFPHNHYTKFKFLFMQLKALQHPHLGTPYMQNFT